MRGYAHVYPRDHINTDEIIPARYLNTDDREELARHALEDLDPGFVGKVKWGDFIVAGENFGCGSSREHAVWALQKVEDGDELEVDLEAGVVRNLTKGEEYKFSPFPDFALEIMRAGGLLEYLRGREG